jgi:branched-chain amino acid transport system substrate-binding protein
LSVIRPQRRDTLRRAAKFGAVIPLVLLVACSEDAPTTAPQSTTTLAPAVVDCAKADSIVACAPEGSSIADLLPDEPVEASGDPIKVGTINQDTGAAGAFPELTLADRVAIDFINTELGGVDGRPLELVTCDTAFNPSQSLACAQQMVEDEVVAVVGGIDVFGDGIQTLADNGIPYVGGIPVSELAMQSELSFQFSGGSWGAVLGFAQHAATDLEAERVAIIYGDFPPIADAAEYGLRALEKLGVEAKLVKTAVIGADWVAALNEAKQIDPDAIFALTADSGCVPAMQTTADLRIDAQLYLTGACAAPKIVDTVGDAAQGAIFNLEADLDEHAPDVVLYRAIAQRYGEPEGYEFQSAGTVSFRAMMNLYAVLREIGAESLTPARVVETLRAAKDRPSFFGHPYTCDGQQLPGLPATCSPQQTLGRLEGDDIVSVSGWIDVGSLV